jgi:hypothetical protein
MQTRHRVVLTTLAVLFVALGIMLAIALLRGDDTHTDKNNSDVNSNSASRPSWHTAVGWRAAATRTHAVTAAPRPLVGG